MENINPFGMAKKDEEPRSPTAMAMSEQWVAAIKAQASLAKIYPRDEASAFERIMKCCERYNLAQAAHYAYPRGGDIIRGPSIDLVSLLAREWGNVDFGFAVLNQDNEGAHVMVYAWDLERNTRASKAIYVRHWRDTKGGGYPLRGERDRYENIANQSARRLRKCLLEMLPTDLVEDASARCTLTAGKIDDKTIPKILEYFAGVGVTTEQLETKMGEPVRHWGPEEVANLRAIAKSMRDGEPPETFFEKAIPDPPAKALAETSEDESDLVDVLEKAVADQEARSFVEEWLKRAPKDDIAKIKGLEEFKGVSWAPADRKKWDAQVVKDVATSMVDMGR